MNTLYRALLLPVLMLLIGLPIQLAAATYNSASNAYERRDYNLAIKEFTELSQKNDPYAQFMLGKMYATGEGTRKDYITAYKWLQLSENLGISQAGKLKNKVSKKMSQHQVARARQLVQEWQQQYSKQARQSENLDPTVVRRVQQRLTTRGYFHDRIDGAVGSKTRNSIRRFQQDARLAVDGRITSELLASLNITNSWGSSDDDRSTAWGSSNDQPADVERSEELAEIATFKKKLRKLIRRAKKRQAAEQWFLEKLEKMAGSEQNPWAHLVLHENFLADNYQRGAGWKIITGNFRLENGTGLIGTVENTWGATSNNIDDLASILLENIFKQSRRSPSNGQLAKIQNEVSFSNAFALKVETGSLRETDGFMLSCGLTIAPFSGYRLAFKPGQTDQIKLFRVGANNPVEIKTYSGNLNLQKAGSHIFQWTRSREGVMAIYVDGQELFKVSDTAITGSFEKLNIAHVGEQVILRDIQLSDSNMKDTWL